MLEVLSGTSIHLNLRVKPFTRCTSLLGVVLPVDTGWRFDLSIRASHLRCAASRNGTGDYFDLVGAGKVMREEYE